MIENIKKDFLQSRKAGDKLKANLLSTLIGEIENAMKSGSKETPDLVAISKIKAFIKNASVSANHGNESAVLEIQILEHYLPKMLSEQEILEKTAHLPDFKSKMQFLKQEFPGLYDGKLASEVLKKG